MTESVSPMSAEIGRRIRARRKALRVSLAEVETMTGGEFRASVLGAYERGERDIRAVRLVRLAEVYGCAPVDMLPATDMPSAPIPHVETIVVDGEVIASRFVTEWSR